MDKSFLSDLNNTLIQLFIFLKDYNYVLSKTEVISDGEIKSTYTNEEKGKKIYISLCNSSNTQRFFISIAIIRMPYLVVHDFVDFDVYLKKNKVKYPKSLEGDQRTIENVNKYLEEYTELFKNYGIELITTDKQFPHYFTEWT